jgi:methylmalonyl-CoA mutase cobalamin-binding domain/chain
MADLKELYDAVLHGDYRKAKTVTEEALSESIDPMTIIKESMIPAMEEIGQQFETQQCYVPELLLAAKAMKTSFELIRPLLVDTGAKMAGKVVIGTVRGDLHDIGKNIVASMLEGSGFEVENLGVDVGPEKFLEVVQKGGCDIVAMSALLSTTMGAMKETVDALEKAGVRDKVKVIVGGPPLSDKVCKEIGADGYGANANAAVGLAKKVIAEARADQ